MSDLMNFAQTSVVEPHQRLKNLTNAGSNVTVDPNMPVSRWVWEK